MANSRGIQAVRQSIIDAYPERANLYSLSMDPEPDELYSIERQSGGRTREEVYFERTPNSTPVEPTIGNVKRALSRCFIEGVRAAEYAVSNRTSMIIQKTNNYAPVEARKALQIFSSFDWQVIAFHTNYYLSLDHRLTVRASLAFARLLQLVPSLRLNPAQRIFFKLQGEWGEGKLLETGGESARLSRLEGGEIVIPAQDIYPDLTRSQIMQLAPALRVRPTDLERSIKQLSYLTVANAARARLNACNSFAAQLTFNVFPLAEGQTTVELDPLAVALRPPEFMLGKDLEEPDVSFDHVDQTKRARIILSGLVKFGAYDKPASRIRIAVLATRDSKAGMERLVKRLNDGSVQYPGARKTFGSEMVVVGHPLVCANVENYEEEIRRFVRTRERDDTDVVLAYMPKEGNITDVSHPYYRTKAMLLSEGLASQMVDRSTVLNPDWRDLNLALNVFAKAGNTPWVLDEALPGVDLFIGLSYSERGSRGSIKRLMSYVNVFDSYGRWKFYQGDAKTFPFNERLRHYSDLIKDSVAAYKAENGGEINSVHIHLTKKFSKVEREALAKAVRVAAPRASVVFVSINPHHVVRLYDISEGSDGSISRATYLRNEPRRLYLATTGNNIFNSKGMGTPVPLELTVWSDPESAMPPLEMIAQQILSLTRLNWASTRSFCREPITTKFAGDIAKMMTAFIDDPNFVINSSLRNTPWFL